MLRRAVRHAFTILSALSLLLCVAVLVFWVLGYSYQESLDERTAKSLSMRWIGAGGGRIGYYRLETVIHARTASSLKQTSYDTSLPVVAAILAVLPTLWLPLYVTSRRVHRPDACEA